MSVEVFDNRPCRLGEGPLWHPERQQLFWFDVLDGKLLTIGDEWQFDREVSAAGWVDHDRLLIASSADLFVFDLRDGTSEQLASLEADNPSTRSNDGRADPQNGFWIGTMGKLAEVGAGTIWRWYQGEVRPIATGISIPNATCFAPDGRTAYFTDTATKIVRRTALDTDGWPVGPMETYLDHTDTDLNPDGAVVDAEGRFWCAEWGSARVACYDLDGKLVEKVELPVGQTSCPAFGGPELSTLFVTSARQGNPEMEIDPAPLAGQTFSVELGVTGQAEHRVVL